MRNRNPGLKSGVGILQPLDVAVQSVFQAQDFAENLIRFAFRKRSQIFQRCLGIFHFGTTVCHFQLNKNRLLAGWPY
jgi:hypothetical protein